jgi:hypothetical protein
VADRDARLAEGVVALRSISLYLIDRQSRSTKTLSRQEPLPSMLMATPASISTLVKSWLVNGEPWSVLKISGRPWRAMASSSASM